MENIKNIFLGSEYQSQENIIKTYNFKNQEHITLHKIGINNLCKYYEANFEFTDDIKRFYNNLFLYFTGSSESNLDLNKGLWISGNTGIGKSLAFNVFKQYCSNIIFLNGFKIFSFDKIVADVKQNGDKAYFDISERYSTDYKAKPYPILIDDILNKQNVVNHYQDFKDVFSEIINLRYNIFEKYKKITHVTTNSALYDNLNNDKTIDKRILSRISKMFNIIELSFTKDFRIDK